MRVIFFSFIFVLSFVVSYYRQVWALCFLFMRLIWVNPVPFRSLLSPRGAERGSEEKTLFPAEVESSAFFAFRFFGFVISYVSLYGCCDQLCLCCAFVYDTYFLLVDWLIVRLSRSLWNFIFSTPSIPRCVTLIWFAPPQVFSLCYLFFGLQFTLSKLYWSPWLVSLFQIRWCCQRWED